MRKLIIILLIAVIACAEVDNTPKEKVSDFNELLDLLDLDANSVELFKFKFLIGLRSLLMVLKAFLGIFGIMFKNL